MYKNYNKFQIKDKGGIRIINNFNYTKKRNEEKKFNFFISFITHYSNYFYSIYSCRSV